MPDANGRYWGLVFLSQAQLAFSPYSQTWMNITTPSPDVMIAPFQVTYYKGNLYCVDNNLGLRKFNFTEGSLLQVINASIRAGAVTTLNFRLVVGNLIEDNVEVPYRLRWSNLDDPATFDPLAYLDLPNQETILSLLPLPASNACAVWTARSVYLLVPTGDPVTPFALRLIMNNVQLIHQRSVALIDNNEFSGHVFATRQGVFVFTGNEAVLLSADIQRLWNEWVKDAVVVEVFNNFQDEEIIVADRIRKEALVYQWRYRQWYRRDWDVIGLTYVHRNKPPLLPEAYGVRVRSDGLVVDIGKLAGIARWETSPVFRVESPVLELEPAFTRKLLRSLAVKLVSHSDPTAPLNGVLRIKVFYDDNFLSISHPQYFAFCPFFLLTRELSELLQSPQGFGEEWQFLLKSRYYRIVVEAEGVTDNLRLHTIQLLFSAAEP